MGGLRATVLLAAALLCAGCGLFLDDLSKGADGGSGGDTDTETGTEGGDTPCDGVDLSVEPWCNLEDSWGYVVYPMCDCPTCPWELDCGDAGALDAGPDAGGGA